MIKDTGPAPKLYGIIAVATLFGIVAAGVAMVMYDYALVGGVFIGLIVASVAAVVLALGWREPQPGPQAAPARQPAPAPKAAPAPAVAPKTDPTPAAPVAKAAAADPLIKPSKPLAGEEELDAKKGDWKYDGTADKTEPAPKPAPAASDDGKPTFLSAAREGGPDDLKQIKGVGPKLEKTLHGMGIYHFDQIAEWGPKEQAWMDDNLEGFKGRATRDNWVEQAKTLAAGGTTEFSSKVKKGDVY